MSESYKFKLSDYYLTFKTHHNGILVLVSKENYEYTAKFGLTKYESFTLYDYDWYALEEEESDQFPPDTSKEEKAAYILFYNIDGGSIGDQKDKLYLPKNVILFLVTVILDMLLEKDLTWLKGVEDSNSNSNEESLYEFIGDNQIVYGGRTYDIIRNIRKTLIE